MHCPVCRALYRPLKDSSSESLSAFQLLCRRCGADLSPLIQLHDQALWYYRKAISHLNEENYPQAKAMVEQALARHYGNADFHALAGRLWALEGEFLEAIASWRRALQFDPQHQGASRCLESWMELKIEN